ncbi:helix-turn-helix domain-containing protein [Dermatophilaceae bacterium Soc4.6]
MTAGRRSDSSPRALRRGRDAVQLGWSPGARGVVVAGLEPSEVEVITGLGGSLEGTVDAAALQQAAARLGVTRSRTTRLLGVLRDHGLVSRRPTSPLAVVRHRHHVVVEGVGPLAWQVATLLRAGGIGRVDLGAEAADDLDQRLRARTPGVVAPHLVVLVGRPVVPAHRGESWRHRDVPVLPVVVEGRRVLVGPLVRDDDGPCLHCLDHVRTDLDAAWPVIATQAGESLQPDDGTLLTLASAVVAMLVRAQLDGPGVPAGVSVEAALPLPRLDHRRWPRHPACAHHRARGRCDATAVGAPETSGSAGERMVR